MGWLQSLFGMDKPPESASVSPTADPNATEAIPPERMGLNGEYDQSGLAKRVALAFDLDAELTDIPYIDVLQTSTTVVLRGQATSQTIINKLISVASSVSGATDVDSSGLILATPAE